MFTKNDIDTVKPSFEMFVKMGQLEADTAKEMLATLLIKINQQNRADHARPKLMKRAEVAEYLGVSVVQVDRLAKMGKLSKKQIGEHTTRYVEADVVKLAIGREAVQ